MSLTTTLLHDFLAGDIATTELTAEASPRRYFRIESGSCPWLFVRSPQDAPIQITTWLASLGVRVPAIGASTDGAYLVEDLGDIHLAHRANLGCYQELMRTWSRFAFADLPSNIPNAKWALDTSLFQKELRQFRQEYLVRFLGVNDTFAESCDAIARQAIAGPQALQHRDFHCRNILLPDSGLAIIDHQDLRTGPLFYDLASLLTDAYIELNQETRAFLLDYIPTLGAKFELEPAVAQRHFQATAIQRVLKALGTFGWLLNQGRGEYAIAEKRARSCAMTLLAEQDPTSDLLRAITP